MIRKRSSFWTVLFSFFPGAGHMFMGFLKQGLSLMAAAMSLIFLAATFHIGELVVLMPLIWFYSFFDALNKCTLPDEDFYTLEDGYMFSLDKLAQADWSILRRYNTFIGWLAIALGASMLINNLWYFFGDYFPQYNPIIWKLGNRMPQLLISVFIIAIGVRLIMGKRKQTMLPNQSSEVVDE